MQKSIDRIFSSKTKNSNFSVGVISTRNNLNYFLTAFTIAKAALTSFSNFT